MWGASGSLTQRREGKLRRGPKGEGTVGSRACPAARLGRVSIDRPSACTSRLICLPPIVHCRPLSRAKYTAPTHPPFLCPDKASQLSPWITLDVCPGLISSKGETSIDPCPSFLALAGLRMPSTSTCASTVASTLRRLQFAYRLAELHKPILSRSAITRPPAHANSHPMRSFHPQTHQRVSRVALMRQTLFPPRSSICALSDLLLG